MCVQLPHACCMHADPRMASYPLKLQEFFFLCFFFKLMLILSFFFFFLFPSSVTYIYLCTMIIVVVPVGVAECAPIYRHQTDNDI